MPSPEASPGPQREGLRSASRTNPAHRTPEDAALICSLRGALRAAIVRLEAHKKRDEQLQAERKAMVEEHAAGTTYILSQGSQAADVNGLFVEKELHAWNEEFRTKKDRASSRLAANYRSLEHDLDSILSDVVLNDALILEMYGGAEGDIPMVDGSFESINATPDTRKRAREVDSPHASVGTGTPSLKRARQSSTAGLGITTGDGPTRAINFEDVYQGGKAFYKHAIVSLTPFYPGRWYIVKCECDHHTVHFGGPNSALQGAAKHLNGRYHGMERSYKAAIDTLGWEVLGCDVEKAALNNAVMEEALKEGYVPLSTLTRAGRKSDGVVFNAFERNVPESIPPPVKSNPITHAVGGELYYAWWSHDGMYYLSMIIPWDNSQDFGLPELARGIGGLGLLNKKKTRVPKCYAVDYKSDPPRITNWTNGYEDGGTKVLRRHYPTLFFHPPRNLAAWTEAGNLKPFDWRRPNFNVPGYKLDPDFVGMALETFARVKGFSCFAEFNAAQRAESVSGEGSSLCTGVSGPARNGESAFRRPDPLGSDAKKGLGRPPEPTQGEDDHPERSPSRSRMESGGSATDDVSKQLHAEAQPGVAAESTVTRSRSASRVSLMDQGPPGQPHPGADQVSETAVSSTVSTAATEVGKSAQSVTASKGVEIAMPAERQPVTDPSPISTGASETPVGPRPSGLPPKPQRNINTPPMTPTALAAPTVLRPPSWLPPKPQNSVNPQLMTTPTSATAGAHRPSLKLPTKPPPGVDGPSGINTRHNATDGSLSSTPTSTVQETPATIQPAQPVSANQATQQLPSAQPAASRKPSPPTSTQAQVGQAAASATANLPSASTVAAAHESPRPALTSNPAPTMKATTQVQQAQPATISGPPHLVKDSPASGGPSVMPSATANLPPKMSPRVQTPSTPAITGARPNLTGPSSQPVFRMRVSSAGSPAPSLASTLPPQSPAVKTETVQYFYLSEYEGPDRFWNADTPTDRLVLEINPDLPTARTLPGQPVLLEIDPSNVTSHNQFRDRPEPGKHTLILKMKDGASGVAKEHRLVFDRGDGVAASRQARRFFSWVTRM